MERVIQAYWAKIVAKVKAKRKAKTLTQGNLAAITGISFQTISRFEQADENIQLSTVLGICDSLGLRLDIQESYSFRVMIFKMLVDGVRKDPYFFAGLLHNADPGHPVYACGSQNKKYPFLGDDNEDKNQVFQFMKSVSDDILVYDELLEVYPLIQTWRQLCELVYKSYEKRFK